MIRLVKGDIRRILHKKSIYIVLLFLLIAAITGNAETAPDQVNSEHLMVDYLLLLVSAVPIFISVYGDELRAGSMQCVIGRGMMRWKIVVSKIIDCIILSLFFFIPFTIEIYIKNKLLGIALSERQNTLLMIYIILALIKAVAIFSVSSFFVYLSWGTAPGLISEMTIIVAGRVCLKLLQERFHIGVYDISIDGLVNAAYGSIAAGKAAYRLIPVIIIYICGFSIAAAQIFKRKELEL